MRPVKGLRYRGCEQAQTGLYRLYLRTQKPSLCFTVKAAELRRLLHLDIKAVGVFVNEAPQTVARLLEEKVIDIAQLHGNGDEVYIRDLRVLISKLLIKAFRVDTKQDVLSAVNSMADHILFDSGSGGTGTAFDWNLLKEIKRPYFLAGGLDAGNVENALGILAPYAVDVSSGIETHGVKDIGKMEEFVRIVRQFDQRRKDEEL